MKFSPSGRFLFQWGTPGTGPGQFDLVHGVSLDAQGRVYVADRSNARVQLFDGDGKFIEEWKSDGIGRPYDIAIGPDGTAYEQSRSRCGVEGNLGFWLDFSPETHSLPNFSAGRATSARLRL